MLVFFYRYVPNILTNELAESLNVTKDKVSVFGSMYFWTYAAMQPIGGVLSDVISPGKLISFSIFISGVGSIIMGQSKIFALSCFARCLVGIGCGPVFVSCTRILANWYSQNKYAIANGILFAMGSVGGCLAQGPLSSLCEIIDWRWAFRISTIVGVVVSILSFFFLRTNISDYKFSTNESLNTNNNEANSQATVSLISATFEDYSNPLLKSENESYKDKMILRVFYNNLKTVFKTPQVYTFIIWDAFSPPCFYNITSLWASRYLEEVMKIQKKTADYWILILSFSMIFGGFVWPFVSNLAKTRKWVLRLSTILGFGSAIGFVFINHNIGAVAILFLLFTFSIGSNGNVTILNSIIKETNHSLAGTMLGIVNFFPFFATGILQILSPKFINMAEKTTLPDDTHSPLAYQKGLWLPNAVFMLVATIDTFFIKETFLQVD